MRYDIAVIGNDESAFEMLSLAVCSGKRSVAILPELRHSSWLVSQALRRLVSDLLVDQSPIRHRTLVRSASPRLLRALVSRAVVRELSDLTGRLTIQGVDVVIGESTFQSPQQIQVSNPATGEQRTVIAEHCVIGTGVCRGPMHRPAGSEPFIGPEHLLTGVRLPDEACVIGGGNFGAGLASLMSLFGVSTCHVAREDRGSAVLELSTAAGVRIGSHPAEFGLSLGMQGPGAQRVVDCRRSTGFTRHLNLEAIQIEPDENGQLWCASNFETWCSGVFGIGDVVGFSPDTALHPSVQAERVMSQIHRDVKRPKMLDRASQLRAKSDLLKPAG